ncbi:MAG: hypothetical protein A2293_06080 [Elusimicrobia bacterium RIFOXYB2_FULL_49_7]|nr:MAG: hypothetical protein A2293_06080 [Elusimicrobia bacterium RIFOXYB2_FULL_49_7]
MKYIKRFWDLCQRKNLLFPILGLLFIDLCLVRDCLWLQDNGTGIRFLANYAIAIIGLCSWLYFLQKMGNRHPGLKIAVFALIMIPLFSQSAYFSVYRKLIPPFGFSFIAEDTSLTFSLFFEHLRPIRLLLILLLSFLMARLLFKKVPPIKPVKAVVNAILGLGVLIHSVFGWYTVTDFQNSIVACYSALLDDVLRHSGTFKVDRPEVPASRIPVSINSPNIIWIIGESANLSHMAIYGYERPTTPRLSILKNENKVVALKNAVSIGNKTNLSVPYMLVGLQGPDPKGRFYKQPTIFNYAKAAGYQTALISAQDFKWGHLDKVLIDGSVDFFRDGSFYSSGVDVLKGTDDMVLIEKGIIPFLNQAKAPFLLVYQMDGSHYPYEDHSPKEYKQFLPENKENGDNAYDNSIVYLDVCLNRLFEEARNRFPDCWIFFSPDHGQNLGGRAGWYNDNFLDNVVHNPLLIFPPDSVYERLIRQEEAPVSQADIFATLLSLLSMKPIVPVDGLSLLDSIPTNRLRTCSEYMPTFHNNPTAILIFPDYRSYRVDFRKKSVTLDDGKKVVPYSSLEQSLRDFLDKKLQ